MIDTSTWTGSTAEWVTAAVAALAVVLSTIAIMVSASSIRRGDFLRVHDRLMSVDVQAGRRMLQEIREQGRSWEDVFENDRETFDRINHAVGMDAMMAQYARHGYTSTRRVLKIWGARLRANWSTMEGFIAFRRKRTRRPDLWEELVWLARKAKADVTITAHDVVERDAT